MKVKLSNTKDVKEKMITWKRLVWGLASLSIPSYPVIFEFSNTQPQAPIMSHSLCVAM